MIAALVGSSAAFADNAAQTYGSISTFASQDVEQAGTGGGANVNGGYFGASGWFDPNGGVDTLIGGNGSVSTNLILAVDVVENPENTIVETDSPVTGGAFSAMTLGSVAQVGFGSASGLLDGAVAAGTTLDSVLSGSNLIASNAFGSSEAIAEVDSAATAASGWSTVLQLNTDSDGFLCVNPAANPSC